MAEPFIISAPHLPPAARRQVAGTAKAWAVGRAEALVAEIDELAGAMAQLAEWLPGATKPVDVLKAIAGAEGQIRMLARSAEVFVDAAGAHVPAAVVRRLAGLPGAGR